MKKKIKGSAKPAKKDPAEQASGTRKKRINTTIAPIKNHK